MESGGGILRIPASECCKITNKEGRIIEKKKSLKRHIKERIVQGNGEQIELKGPAVGHEEGLGERSTN